MGGETLNVRGCCAAVTVSNYSESVSTAVGVVRSTARAPRVNA